MKVFELIEELQKIDPETEVYLQEDPEGNGYAELYCVDSECVWDGEMETMYSLKWSAEDAGMDEDEWMIIKNRERCIVLAP